MLPLSTSTLILGSGVLSASGNNVYINGVPLLTGFRFSGYNGDIYIIPDNNNYNLSFNRFVGDSTGSGIHNLTYAAHSSNTSSVGTVSTSDGSSTAYYMFNKDGANGANSIWSSYTIHGAYGIGTGLWFPANNYPWIQYQFNSGSYLTHYSIFNRAYFANEVPIRDWDVSGSKDGTNWYLVDSQSNQHPGTAGFVTYAATGQLDYYNYYRFIIKSLEHGTDCNAAIAEMNLYTSGDKLPLWSEINIANSGSGQPIYIHKDLNQLYLSTLLGVNGISVTADNGTLLINYTGVTGDASAFRPYINGTGLTNDWNISGQGGIQVYVSGNNLIFYSAGGGGGGGISVNGGLAISGITNLIPSGNVSLIQNGNDVYIGVPSGNSITVNSGTPIQGIINFKSSGDTSVVQSGNDIIISSVGGGNGGSVNYSLSGYYLRQTTQLISGIVDSSSSTTIKSAPMTGNFTNSILNNSTILVEIQGTYGGSVADMTFTILRDNINLLSGKSATNGIPYLNSQAADERPFSVSYLDTPTGSNPGYSLGYAASYGTVYLGRRGGDSNYTGAPLSIKLYEYAYGPQFGINIPSGSSNSLPSCFYVGSSGNYTVGGTRTNIPFTYTGTNISGILNGAIISGNGIVIQDSGYYNIDLRLRVSWNATCTAHAMLYRNGVNVSVDDANYQSLPGGYGGSLSFGHLGFFNSGDYLTVSGYSDNSVTFGSGSYIKGIKVNTNTDITNIVFANSGLVQPNSGYYLRQTKVYQTGIGFSTAVISPNYAIFPWTGHLDLPVLSGSFIRLKVEGSVAGGNGAATIFRDGINLFSGFGVSQYATNAIDGIVWDNETMANMYPLNIITQDTGYTGVNPQYSLGISNWFPGTYNARIGSRSDSYANNTLTKFFLEEYAIGTIGNTTNVFIGNSGTNNGGGTSNFSLNGITGSGILSGINGITVTTSGNTFIIDYSGSGSGGGGSISFSGSGNLISVNGTLMPSGIIDFQGYGGTILIPSGNTVLISGGAGGGGSSIVYRSYGWYSDQVYSGNMIGAVYRIEKDQTLSGFFANTKYPSDVNLFMDVKTSPTITGTWTSLFSGIGTVGKPAIPVGQQLSVSGILVQSVITGGCYLRFDCFTNSTGNGLTTQLSCYYQG